ncbi:epimerase [Edaphobacter acidisoli]|uniref:Epimerase n=1 Tax=Edaphobacter acidisoli TaxID=2040573 RepID=A0A916RFX3_9BACT|nr:epimerase [Edaphobacter acidisoli]
MTRRDHNGFLARYSRGNDVVEADLLNPDTYSLLPDAPNVVFMAGRKFGSVADQPLTWATNVWMAGLTAQRFHASRIVAFSTGNVYPFTPINSKGATEDTPVAPIGEYAQSALARERIFEYFANTHQIPTLIYRLNYAVDLRYGVLVDIAEKVLREQPVDLTTGYANVIWQGDANSYCLRSFALCDVPARALNVTGLKVLSVREVAENFGRRFGKKPRFTGTESETALLSDASRCASLLGPSTVTEEQLIEMTANWLGAGGMTLGKPTKFERRDGTF